MQALKGIVKWFDDNKGYEFIQKDENEIFVHYSTIRKEGHKTLNKGDEVEFELVHTDKGMQSKNVVVKEKNIVAVK